MSRDAWTVAKNKFRRSYIGNSRMNARVAERDRESDMMIAFREGYIAGYNDSNEMFAEKTKRGKP